MKARNLITIALAMTLLSAGCAVMTVDVDVYKGALVNQEDVQTEQLVALSTGAKPLLVQLRDHMEVGTVRASNHDRHGAALLVENQAPQIGDTMTFRKLPEYKAGYMDYRFRDEQAIRVNAVLSLYEDRTGSELAPLVSQAKLILRDYRRAYEVFRPVDLSHDRHIWSLLEKDFRPLTTNGYPNLGKLTKKQTDAIKELRKSYHRFLIPQGLLKWRYQADLFAVNRNLIAAFDDSALEAMGISGIKRLTVPPEETNKEFEVLATGRMQGLHAKLLFEPSSEGATIFEERVSFLAKAFLESRDALQRLLRLVLAAQPLLLVSDASEVEELNRSLADLIGNIVDPIRVEDSFSQTGLGGLEKVVWNKFKFLKEVQVKEGKGRSEKAARLSEELASQPKLPGLLLKLDVAVSQLPDQSGRWRFGLVRGPTITAEELAPADLVEQLMKIEELLNALGLERGRLDIGLESQIENYLQAANERPRNLTKVRYERERLEDSLVGFAQKILFLSNYSTLLEYNDVRRLQEYIQVLQAVGNSILAQVDELRHRAEHRDALERERAIEHFALTNSGLVSNITSEVTLQDSKAVLDLLVTTLRHEHIREVREGKTGRKEPLQVNQFAVTNMLTLVQAADGSAVTNLAMTNFIATTNWTATSPLMRAIEAASEMRNSKMYLRPASAYLRHSYPATSLQQNGPLEWRNMLWEMGLRQTPFAGLAGASDARKRRINREIDKQFWQNVNRIRVSGVGNVNYAVAKDDVGNWYVKQYSASASNIFNSARSLAMYSMGMPFSAKLEGVPTEVSGSAEESAAERPVTVLDRQFESAMKRQAAQTQETLSDLLSSATNIVGVLTQAWHAAGLELDSSLELAETAEESFALVGAEIETGSAEAEGEDKVARGKRLSQVLDSLVDFAGTLQRNIQAKADNSTQNQSETAQEIVRRQGGAIVEKFSGRRAAELSRFHTELNLISEGMGDD